MNGYWDIYIKGENGKIEKIYMSNKPKYCNMAGNTYNYYENEKKANLLLIINPEIFAYHIWIDG